MFAIVQIRVTANCTCDSPLIHFFYILRWLKQVLQRVCYSLMMTQIIGAQQIQADSENVEKLKEQISVLQSDAKDVVESAREFVEMQTDSLHKKIADFLRSRDARDKICTWKSKSCPRQADYKKVYKEATEMVADRIMQVVDAWETKHQFVQGLQESVLHKFEEECKLMDNQLEEVEGRFHVDWTILVYWLFCAIKKFNLLQIFFSCLSKHNLLSANTRDFKSISLDFLKSHSHIVLK